MLFISMALRAGFHREPLGYPQYVHALLMFPILAGSTAASVLGYHEL